MSAAARTATSRDLSFIVFLAIILHKAPAALAFTTFLLQQRKSKPQGALVGEFIRYVCIDF